MDELIDIVNTKGEPTGNTCMKSYAHQNGTLHASTHIWLYSSKGEVLIQKRSCSKDIFPNLWDVSVAGHIESGELPINAATREIKEEINLSISKDQLSYKGIWEEKHEHINGLIDHEIHHIYLAELKTNVQQLSAQKEEVSDLKMISLNHLENNYNNTSIFVPHNSLYYQQVIQLIKEAL